jgi:Fe-S-cluster-containing hydrogenase component 2
MQLSSGYLDIARLNPLLDCRTAYVDAPTCLRFTNNQTAIPIASTDSKSTASTTMAPPRLMLSLPQLGKFSVTARDATPPPCAQKKPTKNVHRQFAAIIC